MIYGMYLSATGVVTNSYRQDVIANNIANSETVGFKRDLAYMQQRPSASAEHGGGIGLLSDPLMGNIDPGMFASPTQTDNTQGENEPTGNGLDIAIQGDGYFSVSRNGQTRLTRNGQFQINENKQLVLAGNPDQVLLDNKQSPIVFDSASPISIGRDGTISQDNKVVATLGVFNVSDQKQLAKEGNTLFSAPAGVSVSPISPVLRNGVLERSNVDPATELTQLMETQRQLEANANMIQTQDETLDKLVNDVGKVS